MVSLCRHKAKQEKRDNDSLDELSTTTCFLKKGTNRDPSTLKNKRGCKKSKAMRAHHLCFNPLRRFHEGDIPARRIVGGVSISQCGGFIPRDQTDPPKLEDGCGG